MNDSVALLLGYADPPYPGCAHLYADHPDYAGEVDHQELVSRLDAHYDGWVLHTSSVALGDVLNDAASAGVSGFRVMAWVKPFAAFKRNVSVAYAWEPVLVKAARKPVVKPGMVYRDWIAVLKSFATKEARDEYVSHFEDYFDEDSDPPVASLLDQGFEDWCSFCGVNPVSMPGLCSSCQEDEDFANCPYCHGTSCTQECEDDELGD